jgi:hypothetical protein
MDLVRFRGFAVALAAVALTAMPAYAGAAAADVTKDAVTLELRKDGVLHVTEAITMSGPPVERQMVTRVRQDDTHDRLFRVSNVRGATFDGTTLTISGGGTVEYDVAGAVTSLADAEELRWFAVTGPAQQATVQVTGPSKIRHLSCFAGALTSAVGCTAASMDEAGTTASFEQPSLAAGETLTVIVGFEKGATGAAPILERRFELAAAFALNTVTGGSLLLLVLLLGAGIGYLYWTRGRDARIVQSESGEVSGRQNGHFLPPDGVRPGQIGTLIDEQADVVDVTATIVDLAVRGYLRIDEQPRQTYDAPDWLLVKLPEAPLNSLLSYERALYEAIFDGRDAVLLSQLRGSFAAGLGKVRDSLYRDMVSQGWFERRPDSVRSRWTTLGILAIAAGVLVTVLLALFTAYALLGLAVIMAGAALAVGGQYMPAKTTNGAAALAHTLGFREYIASGEIGDVPAAQRVELFSRYLPYAVIFDSVDRWARVVSTVPGNGQQTDNLYWYHGPAEWDLSKFSDSMRTFTMTTTGAISASRQFRSL